MHGPLNIKFIVGLLPSPMIFVWIILWYVMSTMYYQNQIPKYNLVLMIFWAVTVPWIRELSSLHFDFVTHIAELL